MTVEEVKKILDNMYGDWRTDEEKEALSVVINLINALDDIKAEIENYDQFILCVNGQKGIHIDAALKIIDKHINGEV